MKFKIGDRVIDQDKDKGEVVVIDTDMGVMVVEFDNGMYGDFDLDGTADDADDEQDALWVRHLTKLDKALN